MRLLLAISITLAVAATAGAVETIKLDQDPDTAYLPYSVIADPPDHRSGDRVSIHRPLRVVHVAKPGRPGSHITAVNRFSTQDEPPHLAWMRFPVGGMIDEQPMRGIHIRDIAVLPKGDSLLVLGTTFRNDTAFIFKFHAPDGEIEYLPVATGTDRTGDGHSHGQFRQVFTVDYDFDGAVEMCFYLNPNRDMYPRLLLCVDVERFALEWQCEVASPIADTLLVCPDSANPGVLFATSALGFGAEDNVFSDRYGYFARIDSRGKVVFAQPRSQYPNYLCIAEATKPGEYFAVHNATDSTAVLLKLNAAGEVLISKALPRRTVSLWAADYTGDGQKEVYVDFHVDHVAIYDDSLREVAISSSPLGAQCLGIISRFDGRRDGIVLAGPGGTARIYSPQLHLLAQIPGCDDIEVLERGAQDEVIALAASLRTGLSWRLWLTPRKTMDYVVIFYRRYQLYVMAALLSLLAAAIVAALYSRRVSRQKRQIVVAHAELARAHENLRAAQAQIISQEKYAQAKDIAGGFAHEIRNALFPADSAIAKLSSLADAGGIAPDRLDKHVSIIARAVSRAIGITRLISLYTKLDAEVSAESVNLADTVRSVVRANESLIEKHGVTCRVEGGSDACVASNRAHLEIVFTNLVLNSLDALTTQGDPAILVSWETVGNRVRVRVSDNGCGIPPDVLPKVFDTFFSTKPNRGTGLGLSTTKKIVEMYGGAISASSEPGHGATFTVELRAYVNTHKPDAEIGKATRT